MPSNKNPATVVQPGPGRLSAGVATQSAFVFNGGAGSSGALAAHLADALDAHMAGAIGIPPTDPNTYQPLLHSAGGVIDGESVLDFIAAAKDLWPTQPNRMGWNHTTTNNSGIPDWDILEDASMPFGEAVEGAFANGTDVVRTLHILPSTAALYVGFHGMVYPADRGVLALYHAVEGDYFAATTTLEAALWLGSDPAPTGIPSASFLESMRHAKQSDHSPVNAGLDYMSLKYRVPALKDYTGLSVNYNVYDYDFRRYQIATYLFNNLSFPNGYLGSYLWVHWKESYATSLAAIDPSQLAANFIEANCYSAVQSPDFDTSPCFNVNRHNIYKDGHSSTAPALVSSTIDVSASMPFTKSVSGVSIYTGANLKFDFTSVQMSDLFNETFYAGTFLADPAPLTLDFSDFGTPDYKVHYTSLQKQGSGVNYSSTNAPQPGDVGEYVASAVPIDVAGVGTYYTPTEAQAHVKYYLRKPFHDVAALDSLTVLYSNQAGNVSTPAVETFYDEKYRYKSLLDPSTNTYPLDPSGNPDDFDSSTALASNDSNLQVIGGVLLYPQTDYSAASFRPAGNPDYSAVLAGDVASHIRRYVRAFDTGLPRVSGKIIVKGLALSDFTTTVSYTGDEVTDHPGGAILQIRVPGSTGWLDLGRPKGDPDLLTTDFRGCQLSVMVSGSDIEITYNTTHATSDNGSGEFPIFVRVSFIKGAGSALKVTGIEWQAA